MLQERHMELAVAATQLFRQTMRDSTKRRLDFDSYPNSIQISRHAGKNLSMHGPKQGKLDLGERTERVFWTTLCEIVRAEFRRKKSANEKHAPIMQMENVLASPSFYKCVYICAAVVTYEGSDMLSERMLRNILYSCKEKVDDGSMMIAALGLM